MKALNLLLPLFVGLTALFAAPGPDLRAADLYKPKLPMEIKVLVVKYFPVKVLAAKAQIPSHMTASWRRRRLAIEISVTPSSHTG